MAGWKLADINFDQPFEAPKATAEIPANRAIQKFIVHGPSGKTFMWDRADYPEEGHPHYHHTGHMLRQGLPMRDLYDAPDTYAGYVEMHGDPYRENAGNEPYVWDAFDHEIPPEVGQHLSDLAKRRLVDPTLKTSAYQDEQGDWQYDDEIEPPPAGEWTPARERYPQWVQRKVPPTPTRSKPPGPPPGTYNWLDRQKPGEIHGLGGDCINSKCDHSWTDEEQHELAQYGEVTCPSCGKQQNNIGQLGGAPSDEEYQKAQLRNNPVRAGITLTKMGQIGEAVIQRIQLPVGPVERDMNAELGHNAPVDFIAGYPGKEYGVEVKANHSAAQPRFKVSGSAAKRQRMIEFCHVHGLRQGFCGVRLNFYTDKADVFWREGFTDTWYGDTQMQHVGTYDFGDLNPFRQSDGSHHVPAAESMPDQAVEGDMQRVASGPGLPPEPGSTPIPPNHVRLYHYTGAPEGVIDQEGLRIDRAKGETYGEPNRVWASTDKPSDGHRYVEFSMAHDDPRWDIGKYQEGINYGYPEKGYGPEAWADYMTKRGSNVTFHGDIEPHEFIGVHEPWHHTLRYLIDNQVPLANVAWLEEREPESAEGRAVAEYRKYLAQHQGHLAKLGADHDGAMVALYLTPEAAKALHVEGGEPAKDLHITMAYFEAKAADEPEGYWAGVKDVIEQVAREHGPLQVTVGGLGRFNGGDDDDFQPLIGTIDCLGLAELHVAIKEKLGDEYPLNDDHGFAPHVTLKYIDRDADDPNLDLPVEFEVDSLSLMVGGKRTDFELSGESHTSAAPGIQYRDASGQTFLNYNGSPEHMDDYPGASGTNAYDGDRLVGSVVHGPFMGTHYVHHFYVDPDYRGTGIGRKLADDVKMNAQGRPIDGDFIEPWLEDYFNRTSAVTHTSFQEPPGARLSRSQPLQVLSPAEYRQAAREPWKAKYDYRKVNLPQANHHCGSCGAFKKGRCAMFDADVENDHTCDEWVTTDEWRVEQDKKAAEGIGKEAAAPQSWWHLTENPKFALDPNYHPENNTTWGGKWGKPGLMVSANPEGWYNGHDYVRPYVAEIQGEANDMGGYQGEHFIPASQFPQTRIKRVIPYSAWEAEQFEGKPYAGPDARDMTPEQHREQLQRMNDYIRDVRPHMLSFPCSHCGAEGEQWNECQSCGRLEDNQFDAYQKRAYMPKFRDQGGDFYKTAQLDFDDPYGQTSRPVNYKWWSHPEHGFHIWPTQSDPRYMPAEDSFFDEYPDQAEDAKFSDSNVMLYGAPHHFEMARQHGHNEQQMRKDPNWTLGTASYHPPRNSLIVSGALLNKKMDVDEPMRQQVAQALQEKHPGATLMPAVPPQDKWLAWDWEDHTAATTAKTASRVEQVPLHHLERVYSHPLDWEGDKERIDALREQIKAAGQVNEPIVIKHEPGKGTPPWIDDGNTRYQLAKELGLPTIPAVGGIVSGNQPAQSVPVSRILGTTAKTAASTTRIMASELQPGQRVRIGNEWLPVIRVSRTSEGMMVVYDERGWYVLVEPWKVVSVRVAAKTAAGPDQASDGRLILYRGLTLTHDQGAMLAEDSQVISQLLKNSGHTHWTDMYRMAEEFATQDGRYPGLVIEGLVNPQDIVDPQSGEYGDLVRNRAVFVPGTVMWNQEREYPVRQGAQIEVAQTTFVYEGQMEEVDGPRMITGSTQPKTAAGQVEITLSTPHPNGFGRITALIDGQEVGKLDFSYNSGRMYRLDVKPEWRRQGIATMMADKFFAKVPGAHHDDQLSPAGQAWQDAYKTSMKLGDWKEDEHPRGPSGKFVVKEDQHKVAAYDTKGKLIGHWERCRHCGTVFGRPASHKGRLHCPTCGEDVDRRLRRLQHVAATPYDNLALSMGWQQGRIARGTGHQMYEWKDPQGVTHAVTGYGQHNQERPDNVRNLKKNMTACMNGQCLHGFGGKSSLPPEVELQAEPGTPLLKAGQQVSYGGKNWWVMDVDGGLAHIYDAKGQEDIVPTQQLRAASTWSPGSSSAPSSDPAPS